MGRHKMHLPYPVTPAAEDIQKWYKCEAFLLCPEILKNTFLFDHLEIPPIYSGSMQTFYPLSCTLVLLQFLAQPSNLLSVPSVFSLNLASVLLVYRYPIYHTYLTIRGKHLLPSTFWCPLWPPPACLMVRCAHYPGSQCDPSLQSVSSLIHQLVLETPCENYPNFSHLFSKVLSGYPVSCTFPYFSPSDLSK